MLASRTRVQDRLAELVVELSGVEPDDARHAIDESLARNGDHDDRLLNVAEAIISLRREPAELTLPG